MCNAQCTIALVCACIAISNGILQATADTVNKSKKKVSQTHTHTTAHKVHERMRDLLLCIGALRNAQKEMHWQACVRSTHTHKRR